MNITKICRDLRKNSTPAEKAFWQIVRNRRFMGLKFNRQYPIIFEYDNEKRFFIADFYCHQLRLIVEIDGGIHETQKDYDSLREEILNNMDYKVIRFKNHEVLNNIDMVLNELGEFIGLTPVPSLIREGNRFLPFSPERRGKGMSD